MTESVNISVARDFSRFPAGRFRTDGPASGEEFRDRLLVPPLSSGALVTVNLDGTVGYGSSFLEEAFGGLVRHRGLTAAALRQQLQLQARDPSLSLEIWSYINGAKPAKKAL
jgi:hypothetical protein